MLWIKTQVNYPQCKREWKILGPDSDRKPGFRIWEGDWISFAFLQVGERQDRVPSWGAKGKAAGFAFCCSQEVRFSLCPHSPPPSEAWGSMRPACWFLLHEYGIDIFYPFQYLRYTDDTTLMAESEEELKSLLMKVKEESEKFDLKLNVQKTKIMASGPITSGQIDRKTVEAVSVYFFGLQNHCRWWLQPWN